MQRPAFYVAFLAGALAACTDRSAATRPQSDEVVALDYAYPTPALAAMPAVVTAEGASASRAAWRPPAVPTAMLIRGAQAVIAVDSVEPAVAALRDLAQRLGGLVANSRLDVGTRLRRSATIELRVPSERFDEAIGGLEPIGRLESVNVTAQDVGEEFVDVTARMANARRLERRLLDLLAARTAKLADVLEVEQALARVREEIERYDGRLRYLQAHVATSSIRVTLQEPAPLVGAVGTSVMGEAVKRAWRNFVTLSALFVSSLGVTIPLGGLGAGIWVWVRRRRPAPAVAGD
jgi:hypothetical protein